jgi:hypothetical protein
MKHADRVVVRAALCVALACSVGCREEGATPPLADTLGGSGQGAAAQGAAESAGGGGSAAASAGAAGALVVMAGASGSPAAPSDGGGGTSAGGGGSGSSAGASAAASGGTAGSAGAAGGGGSSTPAWPPVDDLTGDGPYTAVTVDSSGPGGGYSLYHPQELGPDGRKHPIVTWGNGATTVPPLFPMLPHLATHGFVVIASNNAFVTGEELRAGIEWLEDQNEDSSSPFYQKLDPTNAASMGYSLGSLATFEIAADPHLVTTVHISGGAMDKSVVPNLSHPAAFFCGDPSDIAHANCESDFELATVPVFYGVFPGDHLGILATHATPISQVVTGWLRWRLLHDDGLQSMFVGPGCSLCMDAGWTVKQKDLDVAP